LHAPVDEATHPDRREAAMRLTFFAVVIAVSAVAVSVSAESRFYDRAAEGWFWYRDPPEPEAAPVAPPSAEPSPQPTAAPPAPFSSAWLKSAIPQYLDRALDNPTADNVRAVLYLQRIAVDKATLYSELSQQVTVGDPYLDTEFERPLSTFAVQDVDRAAAAAQTALLRHLGDSIGVLWFYRSDCAFCERQAPVIEALGRSTGLAVMTVSLDGLPMPSGAFAQSFVVDRGQAARLGVQSTPAIFVMKPPDEVELVSQGMMQLSDLRERILLVARRRGWISDEAWEATRPVRRTTVAVAPEEIDPAVVADPAALVAHLRARMARPPR